eukprot:sb/3470099/
MFKLSKNSDCLEAHYLDEEIIVEFFINKVAGDNKDQRVFLKSDGKRFSDGKTLKLQSGEKYVLKVEILPGRQLESISINNKPQHLIEIGKARKNMMIYKCVFDTSKFKMTDDRQRDALVISCNIVDVGIIILPVQCKFYSGEFIDRVKSGLTLESIEVIVTELKNLTTGEKESVAVSEARIKNFTNNNVKDTKKSKIMGTIRMEKKNRELPY